MWLVDLSDLSAHPRDRVRGCKQEKKRGRRYTRPNRHTPDGYGVICVSAEDGERCLLSEIPPACLHTYLAVHMMRLVSVLCLLACCMMPSPPPLPCTCYAMRDMDRYAAECKASRAAPLPTLVTLSRQLERLRAGPNIHGGLFIDHCVYVPRLQSRPAPQGSNTGKAAPNAAVAPRPAILPRLCCVTGRGEELSRRIHSGKCDRRPDWGSERKGAEGGCLLPLLHTTRCNACSSHLPNMKCNCRLILILRSSHLTTEMVRNDHLSPSYRS